MQKITRKYFDKQCQEMNLTLSQKDKAEAMLVSVEGLEPEPSLIAAAVKRIEKIQVKNSGGVCY